MSFRELESREPVHVCSRNLHVHSGRQTNVELPINSHIVSRTTTLFPDCVTSRDAGDDIQLQTHAHNKGSMIDEVLASMATEACMFMESSC